MGRHGRRPLLYGDVRLGRRNGRLRPSDGRSDCRRFNGLAAVPLSANIARRVNVEKAAEFGGGAGRRLLVGLGQPTRQVCETGGRAFGGQAAHSFSWEYLFFKIHFTFNRSAIKVYGLQRKIVSWLNFALNTRPLWTYLFSILPDHR